MGVDEKRKALLKKLPSVDHILINANKDRRFDETPKTVVVAAIRSAVEDLRKIILDSNQDIQGKNLLDSLKDKKIMENVKQRVDAAMALNLLPVVNGTGVVVHTNLGRSLVADVALEHLSEISQHYSNLEFDIGTGKRGSRYSCVEDILCEISGAQSAMVVNNNAAAVLLCLDTIAKDREVVVSRGELVEIGGSFRIPDVMAKSGGILKEVGATNRTHLHDYESAIENSTGLLLKVHTSNYSVVGFTAQVLLKELVELGERYHLPVMEDLGSGTFIDFSKYGMIKEPTVQESIATGVDVVTFSGDKLLGGPQAGIILGKKSILDKIKKNPLTRALRIDKMTLAALEITMRLYRDEKKAVKSIPTLCMLTTPFNIIEKRAQKLKRSLKKLDNPSLNVELLNLSSRAGGGSLPLMDLPSKCIGIKVAGISANQIERSMRNNSPPVIGRIEEDIFIMDLRTIPDDQLSVIKDALQAILERGL